MGRPYAARPQVTREPLHRVKQIAVGQLEAAVDDCSSPHVGGGFLLYDLDDVHSRLPRSPAGTALDESGRLRLRALQEGKIRSDPG
jgi:hypothetical protein